MQSSAGAMQSSAMGLNSGTYACKCRREGRGKRGVAIGAHSNSMQIQPIASHSIIFSSAACTYRVCAQRTPRIYRAILCLRQPAFGDATHTHTHTTPPLPPVNRLQFTWVCTGWVPEGCVWRWAGTARCVCVCVATCMHGCSEKYQRTCIHPILPPIHKHISHTHPTLTHTHTHLQQSH